jgi:methionine synthase I (cobalamin-dependent)
MEKNWTMTQNILELLKQGVVLGDGDNVDEARSRGYRTPKALLEFPDAVRLIHQDYFRAGAQVLRAMTRGSSRTPLKQQGNWEGRMEEINRTAIRLARQVAGDEALVAGCVGPTGAFRPEEAASYDRVREEWDEQVAILVDEGVDLLVCESFVRLDEARIALACCKKTRVPTMVTLEFPPNEDLTPDGVSPGACAGVLMGFWADIVGASGRREPQDLWPVVLKMREAVDIPVAFLPSGYRTSATGWGKMEEAMHVYGMEMGSYALRAKGHGIHFIGGSNGANPRLMRSTAQALECERYHVELRPR